MPEGTSTASECFEPDCNALPSKGLHLIALSEFKTSEIGYILGKFDRNK